jgi:HD-GYP domain-containing protein (c-di-GMP phosphodiesterase class II)
MTAIKDAPLGEYLKIRVAAMVPNKSTTFDLYVLINNKFICYLKSGDSLSQDKIDRLAASKTDVFYIKEADKQEFKKYVHDRVTDSSLSSSEKAVILKESSYALIEELYEHPDVEKALNDSKEIITNFVEFIDLESDAIANLISLSSHDFYTYNHSLDVSIYSLGLGKLFGYNKKDLEELGRGALFHDLGKRMVDPAIICKSGPLNDVEWAQMQQHPVFGLKILKDIPGISDEIKACAFEHHENFLGNGYPQGLDGEDIHPMARIVAITDCYDALTTKRSYNQPMHPRDALNFMMEKLGKKFDPELLRAMHSVLFQLKV